MAKKQRLCPRDSEPLKSEEHKGRFRHVRVDLCPKCQGFFLQRGEIEALIGHRRLEKLLTKYRTYDTPEDVLQCANRDGMMHREDAAGVKVDVCLTCYGVWLDPGELGQLRSMPDSAFKKFTPEKIEELRMTKEVNREHWVLVSTVLADAAIGLHLGVAITRPDDTPGVWPKDETE